MAFHVGCPITCKRICFCTHGFPGNLRTDAAKNHFSFDLAQLHQFLTDPLFLRVSDSQVQVPVPKVSPPPALSADPSPASTDGVAEESLSAQTERAPLQRRAAVADVAAEDFALRFESAALQGSPRDAAGEEQGLSAVNTVCRLCFSSENEGSVRANTMLSCRSCSKKYHRNCLKTWAQNRDLFHWSSWTCPSCRICEVCSRTEDPTKFKFCRRCDAAYHCYCMQPPHKNVSAGPYLCPNHTRCHSCESNVPGNGLRVRWFLGYNCCDACGRLFTKGNYCPVCLRVYRDSESTPMVCCDICQRWVHCHCDNISDEKYLQFQADGNLPYTCATCRGECYQVQDLKDAVREMWRRRDEADQDLIATLRAAAGLPTLEEIFSISPFSDDEDYGSTEVKNEYGRVKLSLKGLAESSPKKSKDPGKKSSRKKKKKVHQMALAGKLGSNPNYEDHRDAVPMGYGQNPMRDVVQALKRQSPAEGICSINQRGDLRQKFVDEAGNDEKRHGILQTKIKRTNNAAAREDASMNVSKQTMKATKLVIHLGGRNRNTTSSPKSDTSSYQREQELAVLNGGEAVSQHRKGEALSAERSDSAANHGECRKSLSSRLESISGRFENIHGMRGVKIREGEGTVIRLGKGKTERSPETGLGNGTSVNGVLSSEKMPILLTRRGGSTTAAGDRTSFKKHSGSRTDVHGEIHKIDSQAPPTSYATPKDSKPLLKLKFKAPFQGSWISHGQEEMGIVKGQRSKRKRPLEKPKSEGYDDGTESEQENLMNEIMDASWILKKLGKDAIGKRVKVQQLSDNTWHKGVVSNLVKGTSMCSVDLDDGRTKTVELGKHGIRFVVQKKQKRPKL